MRTTAVAVVLLIVLSIATYMRRPAPGTTTTPANSAVAAAERQLAPDNRPDLIRESDDPQTVVTNAEKAIRQVAQPYRCQFQSSTQSGPGSTENTILEVASPERYRELVRERSGREPVHEREVIMVLDDGYWRENSGPWQRVSPERMAFAKKYGIPLPIMSGFGYRFDGSDGPTARAALKFGGRQILDGTPVFVYDFRAEAIVGEGKTLRYWIGTQDGLPHKTEEVQLSKDFGTARMVTVCAYGHAIVIEPPK